MTKFLFSIFLAIFCVISSSFAEGDFEDIYNDRDVLSYDAYPNDPNFVPENNFMERADSLNYDENIMNARDTEFMSYPGVKFSEKPMVICRNFGCTNLNNRITRTFLFNSLINIFMMNSHSRLYLCEADPFNRACLSSGISFPVRAGIANAMVKIPKASISAVNVSTGLSKAVVGINYEFLVNGIDRICEPTVMDIVVPINSQATLINKEFACNMTSDGMTNVSIMLNIDYIDLDYGILGGYYSLGLQGPTTGGGTGYALLKTEYSNRGIKTEPENIEAIQSTTNNTSESAIGDGMQDIKPGEYTIEPLQK